MTDEMPSFEATELGLKEYLAKNLHPNNVMWVFREDVSSNGPKVWVRWPTPPGNAEAAKRHYEKGLERGLGMAIRVIARTPQHSCCYVWVPKDNYDADKANLGMGLRYSVVRPLPTATLLNGAISFNARKNLNLLAKTTRVMSEISPRGR